MYTVPKNSAILLIFFLVFFPFNVYSVCGNIPATYPLFSSEEIKLEKDITINGNSVSSGTYSPNAAIDANGTVSTGVSLTLPDLDPASFPSNSSNTDLDITSSTTINQTSETFYKDINIQTNGITVNFTGGGPFHINELNVQEKDVTLNFAAGTYYINKFNVNEKGININITSSPVIFHIGEEFKIDGKDVNINTSGNVDNFIVYLHSGAKFESKQKNLTFTGLIYGPNVDSVIIDGSDSSIQGAIIVSGGIIEIKQKNNSFTYTPADQTAISNISTCQPGGGGDTPATEFNCVENGANGISGKLYTKTTSQLFSFDIVALRDASTIETSFASGADHTVTVELVNAETIASCDSYPALSPAVSQSLTMTSSDSGTKASATMTSSTAYSTVKCRVTDTTDSPSVVGCSTDSFTVRPTAFTITSNLTNTGSTGTPKAKAGDNFTLTATATTGYTGTPKIDNTKIQAHSGAIQNGSISGSFGAASSAVATGTSFIYSEVGSLRFAANGIYDDDFTSVDQSDDCTDDFSNSPDADGKVGCKFGNTTASNYFGRFTPDHLDVTLNTPVFAPACSTFTYLGQPVKYATTPIATVTAKNSSGSTTQNYTGSFWKIDPIDATYGFTPSYSEAANTLTVLESSAPSVTDNGNGTGLLTFADTTSDILAVVKNALTAPFDAEIALSFTLSDTDAIVVANVDGSPQVNPVLFGAASAGNGISYTGSNKTHRWGRLVLNNAHGSELTPLSIPTYTEYYNGSALVKNNSDSCTSFIPANDFSISDPADFNCSFATQTSPVSVGSGSVKASMSPTTVSNGDTTLTISDNTDTTQGPGAGNVGYVEITTKLTNLSWLMFDWDADSAHDNCPSARATFGIYKGNSRMIYFREVY